jgi:hypothetical protein
MIREMAQKRAKLGLPNYSESEEEVVQVPVKLNPWSNKPFSPRYYEIMKTREALPAWQAKE